MEIKLKLCGMRRSEDIDYVNEYRPDYVGFILSGGFRRSVEFKRFCQLVSSLDSGISAVGVFVNEPVQNVLKCCKEGLNIVQLHGDEKESYIAELRRSLPKGCEIWKAIRVCSVSNIESWNGSQADKLLLDAFSETSYGGTGKTADWKLITAAKKEKPFFAAGGINAGNFVEAARTLRPYGIDLSGGIETDGVKDRGKIAEIVKLKERLAEVE